MRSAGNRGQRRRRRAAERLGEKAPLDPDAALPEVTATEVALASPFSRIHSGERATSEQHHELRPRNTWNLSEMADFDHTVGQQ